jgi:hypothetical protein
MKCPRKGAKAGAIKDRRPKGEGIRYKLKGRTIAKSGNDLISY